MQRPVEHIPYKKTRGREDNLMYNMTEGYNLEPNDKTYWDQNNVYDLIVSRKVPYRSKSSLQHF